MTTESLIEQLASRMQDVEDLYKQMQRAPVTCARITEFKRSLQGATAAAQEIENRICRNSYSTLTSDDNRGRIQAPKRGS